MGGWLTSQGNNSLVGRQRFPAREDEEKPVVLTVLGLPPLPCPETFSSLGSAPGGAEKLRALGLVS